MIRRPSGVTPSRPMERMELSKNLELDTGMPEFETGCCMRSVTAGAVRAVHGGAELEASLSTLGHCNGRATIARSTGFPRKSRTSTVAEEAEALGPAGASGCTAKTHSLPRGTTKPGHSCGQKRLGLAAGGGATGTDGNGVEGAGVPMYCTGPMRDVPGVPM
mmetsp:Transcript_95432/g.253588  ORF Transcript_95432/g.253588 Transcript_95432/m.253588 type:complete len:162 (+) Transcript_95432:395-880(+)